MHADKKLYKKAYVHDPDFQALAITGKELYEQLGPGSSECESEIMGIVLEEWKRMQVYNTKEKNHTSWYLLKRKFLVILSVLTVFK